MVLDCRVGVPVKPMAIWLPVCELSGEAEPVSLPAFQRFPCGNFNRLPAKPDNLFKGGPQVSIVRHKNPNVVFIADCHHRKVQSQLDIDAFLLR